MHRPIRGCRVALLAGAILLGRAEVITADDGAPAGAERGADEAIGALVAFLERPEGPDGGRERGDGPGRHHGPDDRGDRPRPDARRPRPGGRRPFDDGPPDAAHPVPPRGPVGPRGNAAPRIHIAPGGPPVFHGQPGGPLQVRAFALEVGPDGVTHGIEMAPPGGGDPAGQHQITVQIDGQQFHQQGGGGPNPGAHAHVEQQLRQILAKLDAIEARLGGPLPPGHPTPAGFGPHPPHAGQIQYVPHPMPFAPPPGPNVYPPDSQQRHNPAPAPVGMNPDEIERRIEERTRDLRAHLDEMARGVRAKLEAGGGAGEDLRRTHERLQEAFQDIRRRFGEQQERLERLEQEVRRFREKFGANDAPAHGDATHPDSGWSLAPSSESGRHQEAVVPHGPATY